MVHKVQCFVCEELFEMEKGVIIPVAINGLGENIICCDKCFDTDRYNKNIEMFNKIVKENKDDKKN